MPQLDSGDTFPDITLKIGEHESVLLPSDIESDYAIILFYRGHW